MWTALLALALAQEAPRLEPPVLLVRPALPREEGRGEAVSVELLLSIDAEGRVVAVEPLSGPEPYLAIAVERAPRLVFSPAREAGVAVPVQVPFTWTFPPPEAPIDVQGVVRTAGPGTPLAGIAVSVGDHRLTTDAEGRFAARGLPRGEVEVRVRAPGWTSAATTVTVDHESTVDVALFASPVHAGEAVAFYRKEAPSPVVRRIPRAALAEEPGAMGDPVRALQNQPGLVRSPLDAGWLLVRGGGTDDTAVYVDGVRVPLLFHLGGLTSIVHPEMVDEVAFTPSFPDADRGGALSGAAEIHTARAEQTRAVAGVNLAYAHAFAESGTEAAGLSIAARRSYLDGVLDLALSDEAGDIAPRFWDMAARGHVGRTDVLGLAIFDSALTPGEDPDEPIVLSQGAAQIQARTALDLGGTELRAQPWFLTERRRLETGIRDERLVSFAPGGRLALGAEGETWRWQAGLEAELREYQLVRNHDFRRARLGRADPFGSLGLAAETWAAEVHLRGETLFVEEQLPRAALSPRLRLGRALGRELTLSAELGRSVQAPDTLATVAFPEGPYLPLERAWTAALGATWVRGLTQVRGALWSRRFALVGYELDGSLGPLDGRADGVELSASSRSERGELRAIVQLSRSQRREDPGEAWMPDLYDQPVRLHLQGQWRLPKRWTLGARARYASGFYNVRGLEESFDLLTQTEFPIPLGRLPPFASLDLRVSKRWDWRSAQLTAYLDVLNTTGRRIPEPAINGIDDAVVVYTFGLPFLPLFGVEGSWWRPQSFQARERATSAR